MIVYTLRPSRSLWPSTPRSAPYRRVQYSRLSTATCAACPRLSSSVLKKRPRSGRAPSSEKKDALTIRTETPSAVGPTPRLSPLLPYAATDTKLRAWSRKSAYRRYAPIGVVFVLHGGIVV